MWVRSENERFAFTSYPQDVASDVQKLWSEGHYNRICASAVGAGGVHTADSEIRDYVLQYGTAAGTPIKKLKAVARLRTRLGIWSGSSKLNGEAQGLQGSVQMRSY